MKLINKSSSHQLLVLRGEDGLCITEDFPEKQMNDDIHTSDSGECGITKSGFEIITVAEMMAFLAEFPQHDRPHRLEFFCILVNCGNDGTHYIDYEEINIMTGDIVVVSPNQVHKFDKNSSYEGYVISFTPDFIFQTDRDIEILNNFMVLNPLIKSPKINIAEEISSLEILMKEIYGIYNNGNDMYKKDILRLLLKTILYKCEREMERRNVKLDVSLDYRCFIDFKNLLEKEFYENKKVNYYAKTLSISPKKLNYLSKIYSGKTIKDIIDERIVLEIKRLLTNTKLTINEVCYKVGFEDPSNFSNYFKKIENISPGEFRKKYYLA